MGNAERGAEAGREEFRTVNLAWSGARIRQRSAPSGRRSSLAEATGPRGSLEVHLRTLAWGRALSLEPQSGELDRYLKAAPKTAIRTQTATTIATDTGKAKPQGCLSHHAALPG